MSGQLVVLDKKPGVSLVGVEETWRQLFVKCVLRVMGPKDTNMCQDYQLCAGLKAGIDGTVHGFNLFGTLTHPWKTGGFYL